MRDEVGPGGTWIRHGRRVQTKTNLLRRLGGRRVQRILLSLLSHSHSLLLLLLPLLLLLRLPLPQRRLPLQPQQQNRSPSKAEIERLDQNQGGRSWRTEKNAKKHKRRRQERKGRRGKWKEREGNGRKGLGLGNCGNMSIDDQGNPKIPSG